MRIYRKGWLTSSPAFRVIQRFRGIKAVAAALDLNPSSVARWLYPRPRGTGGWVPAHYLPRLFELSEAQGLGLAVADLDPRLQQLLS